MQVVISLSGAATASGTGSYLPFQCSATSAVNTAAQAMAQTRMYYDATVYGIHLYLSTNSSANAGTFRLQVNGSNVNGSIGIPALTTGFFEDITNTDAVLAGDDVNFFFDRGSGGNSTAVALGGWMETTGAMLKVGAFTAGSNISAASTTVEFAEVGIFRSSGVAANGQIPARVAFTASNMQLYVSGNARLTDSRFRIRKNTADGTQTFVIPAVTTGMFEDITHTDSYGIGDTLYYHVTTGLGVGNLALTQVGVDKEYTSNAYQIQQMVVVGLSWNSTSAFFTHPSGGFPTTTTEALVQLKMKGSGTISQFQTRVSANVANAQVQFIVNKNGTNTALLTTYAATVTGTVVDTTNIINYQDGDLISIQYSKPTGTGATTTRWMSMVVTPDDYLPQTIFF